MTETDQLRRTFDEDGFVVVPGILDPDQVALLRRTLEDAFDRVPSAGFQGDTDRFLFDLFSRQPDLRWLLFHEPSLAVVRRLFGDDFVVLRESVAQREQYGGWHKDTTSQELAGERFHYEPGFRMAEVAFYLQDDSEALGGGVEVAPGTHLEQPDPYANRGLVDRALGRVRGGPKAPTGATRAPVKAGDLVVFDFRISHRASRGREARPAGNEKLAIFQAVSANSGHAATYHDFITGRPGYGYLDGFAWPPELVAAAAEHQVTLG